MSTTYEHSTTASSSDGIGLDRIYLKNWHGFLKIGEIVVDLIAFICASVYIGWGGGAWVQFVTMSAFVSTLVLYLFYLFRIIYKLPGPWVLIVFVYYCVYSLFLLISGIVSASRAHYDSSIGATAEFIYLAIYSLMMLIAGIVAAVRAHNDGSIVATAFFVFVATALYVVDLVLSYRQWRTEGASLSSSSSHQTSTTTTTRTETYETRTQY